MADLRDGYDELYVYTMGRGEFILQHVVDAFGAQTADAGTKPMALVFSLAGLYLRVEQQYSGRRVQQVHRELAHRKRPWPAIPLPENRGSMTAKDVLMTAPGPERDLAIDRWCATVWNAFQNSRQAIIDILREHRLI